MRKNPPAGNDRKRVPFTFLSNHWPEHIVMPEFFEEQITEVKEQITEVTENVEVIDTPQGAEFVEQVNEIQENVTEVQENIEVIE